MELVNELYLLEGVPAETPFARGSQREALESVIKLLAPFTPHLSEELWERMGHGESIFSVPWPDCDEKLLVEEEWQIVVQVNGRVRGKITLPAGSGEEEANLYGTLTITQYEAMVGARKLITVPKGLQNRLYNVVVPQGIANGQVLRLKHVGKTKSDGTRGDILLMVKVQWDDLYIKWRYGSRPFYAVLVI